MRAVLPQANPWVMTLLGVELSVYAQAMIAPPTHLVSQVAAHQVGPQLLQCCLTRLADGSSTAQAGGQGQQLPGTKP